MRQIELCEPDTESEIMTSASYKQLLGLPETVHW
jgi:hypothetical protein